MSAEHICSEAELNALALRTAFEASAFSVQAEVVRPRVLLSGPLGAGKSTYARSFLEAIGVDRAAEGSPTFSIAHEYVDSRAGRVIHADAYRLKSEAELEETGLLDALWDPGVLLLIEWMDLFPDLILKLKKSELPVWEVRIDFVSAEQSASSRNPDLLRSVQISRNF